MTYNMQTAMNTDTTATQASVAQTIQSVTRPTVLHAPSDSIRLRPLERRLANRPDLECLRTLRGPGRTPADHAHAHRGGLTPWARPQAAGQLSGHRGDGGRLGLRAAGRRRPPPLRPRATPPLKRNGTTMTRMTPLLQRNE